MADDLILCRCEEVTLGRVQEAIDAGACTVHAVKIATRAGMGVCQGRTCRGLVETLVTGSGKEPHGHRPVTFRQPVRPIPLARLAMETDREEGRPCGF